MVHEVFMGCWAPAACAVHGEAMRAIFGQGPRSPTERQASERHGEREHNRFDLLTIPAPQWEVPSGPDALLTIGGARSINGLNVSRPLSPEGRLTVLFGVFHASSPIWTMLKWSSG